MNRFKLGGNLLAAGASLALLMEAYWVLVPNEFPMAYKVVGSLLGSWFAVLIMPPTVGGTTLEFSWPFLLWVPRAAVFIVFLLWIAVKVIQGRFKSDLVPLPVLSVLAPWFLVGLLQDRISTGFRVFELDLKWLLPMLLSDLAVIAMIVGIGLILFSYKEAMTGAVDEVPWSGEMTLSGILFSFEGRINRATFWLYQVLILNLMVVACIAYGVSTGTGEAGLTIGLLLILWPGLALGVKRCHDRNRSGAFVLVSLIPIVSLWYAVEVLFLKGIEGDNEYGPDPLMQQPSGRKEEQAT